MNWIWVVAIIALLFFFFMVYRIGYVRGYKRGGTVILNEWKKFNSQMEEIINDK